MRAAGLSLLVAAAMALGACGNSKAPTADMPAATTPATALTPSEVTAAPAATPAQQQIAGLLPGTPAKIIRPNEDGSETVEEAAGDGNARNPLLVAVAATVAAASSTATAATTNGPSLWQEGTNYTRLVPAQPTAVAPGQIEVLEFFWYACPHCNALDPLVESWKKTKPAYITFNRVHVMWNEGHRSLARLYYTLESMGKLDQLHSEIFKEIHVNGNPLIASDPNDAAGSERIQTAFVKKFGISADAFGKAYHSFGVETSLQRADQLVQRYRVEGVPTFVVNGKFTADVRSAGGPEKLISLVGDLAAQEHKH